jgi:hypothetical protein
MGRIDVPWKAIVSRSERRPNELRTTTMARRTELATQPPAADAKHAMAANSTVRSDRVPWIARMRAARPAAPDPKVTVSFVVARDDLDGPTIWRATEVSPRVRHDFAAGTILQDRYRLIRELGRG